MFLEVKFVSINEQKVVEEKINKKNFHHIINYKIMMSVMHKITATNIVAFDLFL